MAQGMLRVDLTRYRRAVAGIKTRLTADTFKAVNLAAQVTAELLRQYTPRLTGQTAKSIRWQRTGTFDAPAVAGFFPAKGNTAFVARILEIGRKARPGGRRWLSRRRNAEGVRIARIERAVSAMAPRPIVARVLPLVPAAIREAFRRVFGPDWRPRKSG